jgi:hypothetical protein
MCNEGEREKLQVACERLRDDVERFVVQNSIVARELEIYCWE